MKRWEKFLLDKKAVDMTNWDELIPLHDAQEACRIAEIEGSEDYKKALKYIVDTCKRKGNGKSGWFYTDKEGMIFIEEIEKLIE